MILSEISEKVDDHVDQDRHKNTCSDIEPSEPALISEGDYLFFVTISHVFCFSLIHEKAPKELFR